MTNQDIINAITSKSEYYQGLDLAMRMRYYYVHGFSAAWFFDGSAGTFCMGESRREGGYPINAQTIFQAGSISKAVFAGLVMRLYDMGRLDIYEDVNKYLSNYSVVSPGGDKITIRMLLSHMAGFNVHGFAGYSVDSKVTNDDVIHGRGNSPRLEIDFPPNTCWRYSGGGYQIAQKAVEDVLGEDIPSLAKQHVFLPLGMKDSGFWQPLHEERRTHAAFAVKPNRADYNFYPELAAAGLWSTPSDLVIYARALRGSLFADGFLKRETALDMTEEIWKGRCVGLFTDSAGEFYHGGTNSSFESLMLFSAEKDFAFAIMTNTNGANALNREIAQTVKASLAYEPRS